METNTTGVGLIGTNDKIVTLVLLSDKTTNIKKVKIFCKFTNILLISAISVRQN